MSRTYVDLKPRKQPLQARSASTVDSIFEATIRVLREVGVDRLTTTRVATRAGVSVGSLYQYFPNRQALLAAVLERHLAHVVAAIEVACAKAKGQSVELMASSVVHAFFAEKFRDATTSRALYEVSSAVGGSALVDKMTQRSLTALGDMLATSSLRFTNLSLVSYVFATAMVGPVQGLLSSDASADMIDAVQGHLTVMISAFLGGIGAQSLASDS